MEIVIAGGGKIGEKLCEEYAQTQHNINLIELEDLVLNNLINKYDVNGIIGNGASIEILQEAGVASADVFIAVTEKDEINIIASVLAKNLGAKYTISRVRNPEYSAQTQFVQERLGINLVVNPELETARYIAQMLKYSAAISVESFADNRVNLVEIEVEDDSALNHLEIKDFRQLFGSVIVCIIHRSTGEILIPKGDQTIYAGDRIYVTGTTKDLNMFMKKIKGNQVIDSTLIVGSGRIGYYLLQILQKTTMFTRVLEINDEQASKLGEQFPKAEILVLDGTDQDILDEQGIENFDAFVSLTGIDEENLISSMYAKIKGVEKVIAKLSRTRLLDLIQFHDIKSFVNPKSIVADKIIQFIRALENSEGSTVEALYRLMDCQVEALQFLVTNRSRMINQKIKNLSIRDDILIAYLIRENQLVFPTGEDQIKQGDRLIVIAKHQGLDDVDDILE